MSLLRSGPASPYTRLIFSSLCAGLVLYRHLVVEGIDSEVRPTLCPTLRVFSMDEKAARPCMYHSRKRKTNLYVYILSICDKNICIIPVLFPFTHMSDLQPHHFSALELDRPATMTVTRTHINT